MTQDSKLLRIIRRLQGQDVDLADAIERDADYAAKNWAPANQARAARKERPDAPHFESDLEGEEARDEMREYQRRVKDRLRRGEDPRKSRINRKTESGAYEEIE
jgi:hypothetical protein